MRTEQPTPRCEIVRCMRIQQTNATQIDLVLAMKLVSFIYMIRNVPFGRSTVELYWGWNQLGGTSSTLEQASSYMFLVRPFSPSGHLSDSAASMPRLH